MSKISWDDTGKRFYETGVDHGVLYPVISDDGKYSGGVAWNGLSSVTENPSGADSNAIYADNIKYLNLTGTEEFGATVEAYTYPDEFEECDGSKEIAPGITIGQQNRKTFGMSYRTVKGNDLKSNDYGYKLHLIYGAKAAPSSRQYQTVNESPDAISFSWELTTTPVPVTGVEGMKPTALLTIDSSKTSKAAMDKIEEILYGTAEDEPRLPLPDEVIQIIQGLPAAG